MEQIEFTIACDHPVEGSYQELAWAYRLEEAWAHRPLAWAVLLKLGALQLKPDCLSCLQYVGSSCRGCSGNLDEEHHYFDSCCGHHGNYFIIVGIQYCGVVQLNGSVVKDRQGHLPCEERCCSSAGHYASTVWEDLRFDQEIDSRMWRSSQLSSVASLVYPCCSRWEGHAVVSSHNGLCRGDDCWCGAKHSWPNWRYQESWSKRKRMGSCYPSVRKVLTTRFHRIVRRGF